MTVRSQTKQSIEIGSTMPYFILVMFKAKTKVAEIIYVTDASSIFCRQESAVQNGLCEPLKRRDHT